MRIVIGFLLVALAACGGKDGVNDETHFYEAGSQVCEGKPCITVQGELLAEPKGSVDTYRAAARVGIRILEPQ
jgi:hypothetical protein